MKYLIPSALDHPEYKGKRYDFSFKFSILKRYKWEHVEGHPYDEYIEYKGRKYLNIIGDDERSGLGINGLLKNDDGKYVGEVVNDWAHGRGTILYNDGTLFDGEFKNGKKDGWGKYISKIGIRSGDELIDEAFEIKDEEFPDEWHYFSVKGDKIYICTEIFPCWYLDIYKYKVDGEKLMVKCIDRLNLESSNGEVVMYDAPYPEECINKIESKEYTKKISKWHEFKGYIPAKMYIMIRALTYEKFLKIANSELKKLENFDKEMGELCNEYNCEWKYDIGSIDHTYKIDKFPDNNKSFNDKLNKLLKKYEFNNLGHGIFWYEYVKEIKFIKRCGNFDEFEFYDLIDQYFNGDISLERKIELAIEYTGICKRELAEHLIEEEIMTIEDASKIFGISEKELEKAGYSNCIS